MSIEIALYAHLTNDTGVNALVGSRVYPLQLSQGAALPAISYQRISGPREYDLAGPTGRSRPRMQIDCWANSYSTVKNLASKVISSLNGLNGNMGGVDVDGIELEGERDGFEETTEYKRVILEFKIPCKETT